ncbi:hypothetical protein NUW58_g8258 [Xylaria curta]|uniref:Uncharacterized protein n=1 Tax=Xylaria curta TaxID=42375 RepID=A0ACC1NA87_9PEZI|nr:hypothetical protein NUW58_g8258 [Xylaria curta]
MRSEVYQLFGAALLGASQAMTWQFPHTSDYTRAQKPLGGPSDDDVDILYGSQFNGLTTYARIPYVNCFSDDAAEGNKYDIAILGAPFDTLGRELATAPGDPDRQPEEIRRCGMECVYGSVRPEEFISAKAPMKRSKRADRFTGVNALKSWANVVDCGDVPLTYLDNNYALAQLTKGHKVVSGRKAANQSYSVTPRIITLGGDHTTTLPALRSTHQHWGKVSVIHFDSHIGKSIHKPPCLPLRAIERATEADRLEDTWDPLVLSGGISDYAAINHGTFLHIAHEEGLVRNSSIHAGIRGPLASKKGDIRNDERCGFARLTSRDIDRFGVSGIVSRIRDRVTGPVYISVDIDVLDPAFAPGMPPHLLIFSPGSPLFIIPLLRKSSADPYYHKHQVTQSSSVSFVTAQGC